MMVVLLPRDWGEAVAPRGRVSLCFEYTVEAVGKALSKGERLFLIGADAIGRHSEWRVARDHIALFGTGVLAGPNDDEKGPRFPNLRGMYIMPACAIEGNLSAVVMRVPSLVLSTGAELDAFRCDALAAAGIDLAISAAHGGARVCLVLRCRPPGVSAGGNGFAFLDRIVDELEGCDPQ
jgi:hypothetical protein